ncbi:MAG: putative zinc-binding metallopeptidase [Gammaproteobacteria bacterium]
MPISKHSQSTKAKYPWVRKSRENLLDMRICDLGLHLENSAVMPQIRQLYAELERRRLRFQPHFWFSDEWYCPDGVPGVAIPFFLAHPKLKQLELEYMLEVEGGDPKWCMKLLRHETGHAILNAYKLTRDRNWRAMFGNPNAAYKETYLPKPYSKRFVINLPGWYAQSHPHEDWAETFAVWLDPRSDWRHRYQNWHALKKLQYVDAVMTNLSGKSPLLRNKQTEYPVDKIKLSLRKFYEEKRQRYGLDSPEFFDVDLRKLFADRQNLPQGQKASRYLRSVAKPTLHVVERWTGEYKYRINEVLKEMIRRCDQLGLRADPDSPELLSNVIACVTMVVMNKLHSGGFHLAR